MKFGKFYEAYLDKKGRVHICKKHKVPSVKLNEKDTERKFENVLEIKGKPFVDICFTRLRLFCLTEKGEVYMYKINETFPECSETALLEKEIKTITEFDPT